MKIVRIAIAIAFWSWCVLSVVYPLVCHNVPMGDFGIYLTVHLLISVIYFVSFITDKR